MHLREWLLHYTILIELVFTKNDAVPRRQSYQTHLECSLPCSLLNDLYKLWNTFWRLTMMANHFTTIWQNSYLIIMQLLMPLLMLLFVNYFCRGSSGHVLTWWCQTQNNRWCLSKQLKSNTMTNIQGHNQNFQALLSMPENNTIVHTSGYLV